MDDALIVVACIAPWLESTWRGHVAVTGEKLTPQLVSTLTEPFQRGAERIRSDYAGFGLGLAIVKSSTEAHDGTLTLTPRGRWRAPRSYPSRPHTDR